MAPGCSNRNCYGKGSLLGLRRSNQSLLFRKAHRKQAARRIYKRYADLAFSDRYLERVRQESIDSVSPVRPCNACNVPMQEGGPECSSPDSAGITDSLRRQLESFPAAPTSTGRKPPIIPSYCGRNTVACEAAQKENCDCLSPERGSLGGGGARPVDQPCRERSNRSGATGVSDRKGMRIRLNGREKWAAPIVSRGPVSLP